MRELLDSGITKDTFLDINDVIVGYMVMNAMVPGQIEQYLFICDLSGVKMWEIPFNHLIGFVKHNSAYYKHRVAKLIGVNIPWAIRKALDFVWPFLDSF